MLAVGAVSTLGYIAHARNHAAPILDLRLFLIPTFRLTMIGGFLFRTGMGALPFLMPLLLQLGFFMSPFQSGLITFSTRSAPCR